MEIRRERLGMKKKGEDRRSCEDLDMLARCSGIVMKPVS